MCGIFGLVKKDSFSNKSKELRTLVSHAEQRGKDSSGIFIRDNRNKYMIYKSDKTIIQLHNSLKQKQFDLVVGHSRLVTNGQLDNQPLIYENIIVFHNGIIVNTDLIWNSFSFVPKLSIDTEIIPVLFKHFIESKFILEDIPKEILKVCKGIVSCAVVLPELGKICLFSNNGSLYFGEDENRKVFSSEKFPLKKLGIAKIRQVFDPIFINIPSSVEEIECISSNNKNDNIVPSFSINNTEDKSLKYYEHNLLRCKKCILPATMPYIQFDSQGVCNYCNNYKSRNIPKKKEIIENLILTYKNNGGSDCIIPFSGGRDSSYALHLAVKELKLKPVTYTYDWGMVTDLARRNISRMCEQLAVENIIVAADIRKKRKNIKKNLIAWLNSPNLGMVSILTAGDKHFFHHIETIKKQTGINLNLWGVCPLEVTHFKSGFLGIAPDFEEKHVYSNGTLKQLRYQVLRFKAMLKSPRYFNSSLWDTLSGEYYRSIKKKKDYFHIFDFWRWDEKKIESTLCSYDWEKAPDTNSTWRIGDGTAALYNYIYYTMTGFTEHDTFRSNQIREGDLSRKEALELVQDENRPRYQNIKWYLDAIGLDFDTTIKRINSFNITKS